MNNQTALVSFIIVKKSTKHTFSEWKMYDHGFVRITHCILYSSDVCLHILCKDKDTHNNAHTANSRGGREEVGGFTWSDQSLYIGVGQSILYVFYIRVIITPSPVH